MSIIYGAKVRSLERYIYKKLGLRNGSTYLFCNLLGVYLDIKPAAMGDWAIDSADEKSIRLLKKKLLALGIYVVDGGIRSGNDFFEFYASKSVKRAEELRNLFEESFNKGRDSELNTKLGKMLGYPDTAIQYYIRLHPENGVSKNHLAMINRNRFYAHSLAHEDDEFLAYEYPLYKYIEKHCPRTAKFLKSDTKKRWLD